MAFGIDEANAPPDDIGNSNEEDVTETEASDSLSDLIGEEGGERGRRLAMFWKDQIDKVDVEWEAWQKKAATIETRYRNDRKRTDEEGQRRTANLWANVQILLPALYGRCPMPVAERRFKDKDPIGRSAAQIIERALRNEIEINDYHDSVSDAVLDYLLGGRGAVWVRYEPEFEESISIPSATRNDLRDARGKIPLKSGDENAEEDDANPDEGLDPDEDDDNKEIDKLEDTGDELVRESAQIDYIDRKDLYLIPAYAKRWKNVTATCKRVSMSRDQMIKRFGRKIGKAIPLQRDNEEDRLQAESRLILDRKDGHGEVFEIWDKDSKCAFWVATGYEYLADVREDPLQLEHFFPMPKPLFANPTNGNLIPVSDYQQYQDQEIYINELTQRISQLSKVCKIAGTYNAACDELARLLDESVENELIPVDNWVAFAEKGGLKDQISLLPIADVIEALKTLFEIKQQAQTEMDRITGMTDVLRGVQTDGRVTLGGQKLQGSNGRTRLQWRQNQVSRFCRDVVRLMAEVMCKHFSARSLIEASGALYEEGLGVPDVMSLGFSGGTEALHGSPPQIQGPMGMLPRPGSVAGAMPPSPGMMPQAGAPGGLGPPSGAPHPPGLPPPVNNFTPPVPTSGAPPRSPPMGAAPQAVPPPTQMQPGASSPFGPMSDESKLFRALKRIQAGIMLLRSDHKRGFRVDIDVDSNILGDQEEDKASRVEFIEMASKFMQQAAQMVQMSPDSAPLIGKLLQFGVRGFRVGRELESAIEDYVDKMEDKVKQMASKPPPPNPQMIEAQAKQMEAQVKVKEMQGKLAAMGNDAQADKQRAQAEIQKQAMESQTAAQDAQTNLAMKKIELQMKGLELEIKKMELSSKAHEAQHTQRTQDAEFAAAEQDRNFKQQEHQAKIDEDYVQQGGDRKHANQALHDMIANSHAELIKHMSAPRKVVRDKAGRVIGVMMDGGQAQ